MKQELPAGWELEWIVQEDGRTPHLRELLERYDCAKYSAHNDQLGGAVTKNLALTRAQGQLVHALDSDDLLLPGALRIPIDTFEAHPELHWVSAQADDLLPDGTRVPWLPLIGPGRIEVGVVERYMIENDSVPIACPGLTMRTSTVRALGGWAANPRWEDTVMFATLAMMAPGWVTDDVTWLYRQHEGQTTRQADWPQLQAELWTMVRQRISATLEVGLQLRYSE